MRSPLSYQKVYVHFYIYLEIKCFVEVCTCNYPCVWHIPEMDTVKILNYSCPIGFSLKLMVHKCKISSRFWINNMPWNKHMYDSINLANKNDSCLFPSLFKKPVKCYFVLFFFLNNDKGNEKLGHKCPWYHLMIF